MLAHLRPGKVRLELERSGQVRPVQKGFARIGQVQQGDFRLIQDRSG
jgi:hypothetical protein